MATITGLTAERMLEIEDASIIDGEIRGGDLILIKHDGTEINAGPVEGPVGPSGPAGPSGISAIPGEVKLWPGAVLPAQGTYGKWVWADGAIYPNATYPLAAAHIAPKWRTFDGASDPGGSNFRVPDLRGLVAAGLDAMPGGTRANRMTRAVAIILGEKAGRETYDLKITEMARHSHGGATGGGTSQAADRSLNSSTDGQGTHSHTAAAGAQFIVGPVGRASLGSSGTTHYVGQGGNQYSGDAGYHSHGVYGVDHLHGIPALSIAQEGDGTAHENVQPTVFVPYIVKLDG